MKLLGLLLLLALPAAVQAQFNFTTNNGAITITGYTGSGSLVIIPSATNGYPVVSIETNAFKSKGITSVIIPTSVTNIGDYAFEECHSLTNVTIPSSITNIGNYVFGDCVHLPSITIPGSVISIGTYAFAGCGLTNITIPSSVTNIGDYAFDTCMSLSSITIPGSVISIGQYAFSMCRGLTNIVISNGVGNIGASAFSYTSLTNGIIIPGSITNIGNSAFSASGILAIYFEGNAPSVGSFASPGILYYLPGFKGWSSTFGGDQAVQLYNCTTNNGAITITGYYGPLGPVLLFPGFIGGMPVTSIGSVVFASKITSVTIPISVINIGQGAFENCRYMPSITIPNAVTTIGPSAFQNCISLTNVMLGSSLTSIGGGAFFQCGALTSINIPNSVTNIEGNAFSYCTNLTSIIIPGGVTSIAGDLFEECSSLTNAMIGSNVTSIEEYAFSGCTSLTDITFPNGLTSIGHQAFSDCGSLTSISIPDSVTNIADEVFTGDNLLTAITVGSNNPAYSNVNGVLFNRNQTLLVEYPGGGPDNYTIPNSVINIGDSAFGSCYDLTNVIIGSNVTYIGNFAFVDCALTNVTIPNNVTNIGQEAFGFCPGLVSVYFEGDAPYDDSTVFNYDNNATAYYLPGTTNWGSTFGGVPTALWNPTLQTTDGGFGVQNNQFGFNITGTTNIPIVVEVCTNLTQPSWTPLLSATVTNGGFYFSDPQWANYPGRYYRISSP